MTLKNATSDAVTFDGMWAALEPIGREASTGCLLYTSDAADE